MHTPLTVRAHSYHPPSRQTLKLHILTVNITVTYTMHLSVHFNHFNHALWVAVQCEVSRPSKATCKQNVKITWKRVMLGKALASVFSLVRPSLCSPWTISSGVFLQKHVWCIGHQLPSVQELASSPGLPRPKIQSCDLGLGRHGDEAIQEPD